MGRREIKTLFASKRMFLDVRSRMIAIHPMTKMLEEQPFQDRVSGELQLPGEVQFILRTGHLNTYPPPVIR